MITKQLLDWWTPHQVLDQGQVNWQRWVAVRGVINDWAVYKDNDVTVWHDIQQVIDLWTKVHDKAFLLNIVKCDQDALELYRD